MRALITITLSVIAASLAAAAFEGEITTLSKSVVIEKVPIGMTENETAHRVLYNNIGDLYGSAPNETYDRFSASVENYDYGFKFQGLGYYIFVLIWSGGKWTRDYELARKVCAVYKPEINDYDSKKHVIFSLMPIPTTEIPYQLLPSDVVDGLEQILSGDSRVKAPERFRFIIPIAMYIFYWRQINCYSGLYFSEKNELTDGFVLCENPLEIEQLDLYDGPFPGNEERTGDTEMALYLLPRGKITKIPGEVDMVCRSFYTWDSRTHIIRYWVFGIDKGNAVHIRDTVLGTL